MGEGARDTAQWQQEQVDSFLAEVGSGDSRRALIALRDELATAITHCEPRDLSALSRQLRDTLTAIDRLANPEQTSTVDQLKERRQARRSTAKVSGRASGGTVGRSRGAGAGR